MVVSVAGVFPGELRGDVVLPAAQEADNAGAVGAVMGENHITSPRSSVFYL
jgi:hypothetical protein